METKHITLHGHRVTYRAGGDGPVLLLIHGITGTSETWDLVAPALTRRFRVLAPDLLGHGLSAKPRGDYSLGAYAAGLRDLLAALGHDRATVVGHSLGGGVAMQFAYQFPQRIERLGLVCSGGLGREVHALLRAAALPGAEYVMPLICTPGLRDAGNAVAGALARIGLRAGPDLQEMWRGYTSLADAGAREAFVHTLRTIIDPTGQRVNAMDRLYLASEVPTLLVWGERDGIIPVEHGRAAHAAIPGSRFVSFPEAKHFPHREDPTAFADTLTDFIDSTTPAAVDEERWRRLVRNGAGRGRVAKLRAVARVARA
jgi:pimeloyl-ACP methyl ester carboxylesterase